MRGSTRHVAGAIGLVLTVCVASADAMTLVERGHYLALVAGCVNCHTARGSGPVQLAGGVRFGAGPAAPVSANITPDDATGIGRWTPADIVTALRDGRRPDGTRIGPPMPQEAYAGLTDGDAAAIAAYLKSVPPARHVVAKEDLPNGPLAAHGSPKTGAGQTRGRYLFEAVAHCGECHDGPGTRGLDHSPSKAFAGPNGPVVAPPLTNERLASLSDDDLKAIITRGQRADGSKIVGPMPVAAYTHLTNDDLDALVIYLKMADRR